MSVSLLNLQNKKKKKSNNSCNPLCVSKATSLGQLWWHKAVIPALQEAKAEFQTSLGQKARTLKKQPSNQSKHSN